MKKITFISFIIILIATPVLSQENIEIINPDMPKIDNNYKMYQNQLSTINLPIKISMADIQARVNQEFGKVIYHDNSYKDNGQDDLKIKVTRRSDITLGTLNNQIKVTVPLTIWVSKRVSTSILGQKISQTGETDFEITVNYFIALRIKKDWDIQSKTTGQFKWDRKPYIEIGILQIPIASQVEGILKQEIDKIAGQIDQQIKNAVNIKEVGTAAWKQMHKPILIDSTTTTWLYGKPQKIHATQLRLSQNKASLGLGIETYVENTIGEPKRKVTVRPLPDLNLVEQITNDFNVSLSADARYENVKEMMQEQFLGKTFKLDNDEEQFITVTGLDLIGSAEKIIIQVDIDGKIKKSFIKKKVKGTIYLEGIPYYEPDSQEIRVKELDYTLKTKDILLKMAKWFTGKKFQKNLEQQLVFPVGMKLESAKKMITQQLKNYKVNEYLTLKGELNEMQPQGLYLTPESIRLIVLADGTAGLTASGF